MDSSRLAPSWIFLFLFIRELVWKSVLKSCSTDRHWLAYSPLPINREADTHAGQVKDLEEEINENVIPFSIPGRSQALPSETAVSRRLEIFYFILKPLFRNKTWKISVVLSTWQESDILNFPPPKESLHISVSMNGSTRGNMENEVFTPLLEQFMLTPLVCWVIKYSNES